MKIWTFAVVLSVAFFLLACPTFQEDEQYLCSSDAACPGVWVCDPALGRCVECLDHGHCDDGYVCVDSLCSAPDNGENGNGNGNGENGNGNGNGENGNGNGNGENGNGNGEWPGCEGHEDCTEAGAEYCNLETRECVECVDNDHCGPDSSIVCEDGKCKGTHRSLCNYEDPCIQGLECVGGRCMKACDVAADCSEFGELYFCHPHPTLGRYCNLNICGTHPTFESSGFSTTTWSGPCTVDTDGDGTCVGPLWYDADFMDGRESGLCYPNGLVQPGDECNPSAPLGHDTACDGGSCEQTNGGEFVCLAYCTLAESQTCDDVDDKAHTCYFHGPGRLGLCGRQSNHPAEAHEYCTLEDGCVDHHVCMPDQGGERCVQWCNLLDPDCPNGKTCSAIGVPPDYEASELLGACRSP